MRHGLRERRITWGFHRRACLGAGLSCDIDVENIVLQLTKPRNCILCILLVARIREQRGVDELREVRWDEGITREAAEHGLRFARLAAQAGREYDAAKRALKSSGNRTPVAIVMLAAGVDRAKAASALKRSQGHVRHAIELAKA